MVEIKEHVISFTEGNDTVSLPPLFEFIHFNTTESSTLQELTLFFAENWSTENLTDLPQLQKYIGWQINLCNESNLPRYVIGVRVVDTKKLVGVIFGS